MARLASCILLAAAFLATAAAQTPFSEKERLCGYRDTPDIAVFIFDEAVYASQLEGRLPVRVVLEGSMRGWAHDMTDAAWQLHRDPAERVWLLSVPNLRYAAVPPGTQFKFRVDDGRWMDAPPGAPNLRMGNLLFAHAAAALELRAELRASRAILLRVVTGIAQLSLSPSDYRLSSAAGEEVPIASVRADDAQSVMLEPAHAIDSTRVWYIEERRLGLKRLCSFDGWYRTLGSEKELGANYDPASDRTAFRVFSPRATRITLFLYETRTGAAPVETVELYRDRDAVWEVLLPGNLEGRWYDFTVYGPADPGNEFFQQVPVHVGDPYARVVDDSYGRCRVWPKTAPATPLQNGIPPMERVIAYEVHVEDFTHALPGLDDLERGTFSGFAKSGLKNAVGAPVGIDHLVDLGINTVHLLPVQEYLNYADEEWAAAFANDPYMIAQGIAESNYDWGYRTSQALAIETRYRERGTEFGEQNTQFRNLVQAFHDRGIAVVVDVVFNHTAERMDGRELYFGFRVFDRHAYYRTNDSLAFIGDYGTETKSEDRPMLRRWIIDQCKSLVNEYGVDGFRIDLARLTDTQTLQALRDSIGRDKIVYGEPWIASSDPDFERNPAWTWSKSDAPITFFQDDCRNALCGPPDNPSDKRTDRGYAGGNGNREAAKRAIANNFNGERTPNAGINYLDIHDNWALADRFAVENWNGEHGVDEGPYRIAAAMLLTSLGPVVLHGGSEFMRSKGSAPLEEIVKQTARGPVYIHGKRDTYNLRTANAFQWENLGRNITDGARCNYGTMNAYWKGLIALRNSDAGSVFRIGTALPAGYIQWVQPSDPMQLGYVIGAKVFVLVNTSDKKTVVSDIRLPGTSWLLVADGDKAGTAPLTGRPDSVLKGAGPFTVELPETSVKIWVRND